MSILQAKFGARWGWGRECCQRILERISGLLRETDRICAPLARGQSIVGRKFVIVRVHDIVNGFISKKAQDIVNGCSLLTYLAGLPHAFTESERAWMRNKSIDCAEKRSECICRARHNKRFWQEFSVVAPG